MPVRSSTSHVLRWPAREEVDRALAAWVPAMLRRHPECERLGIFGSYVRGDWGVGSDLDLVAVVVETEARFERRPVDWPREDLPVAADLLVYTRAEWAQGLAAGDGFLTRIAREVRWLHEAQAAGAREPSTALAAGPIDTGLDYHEVGR
jgi:uncharacterized protein